jgi:hypothetical protein
MTSDTSKKIIKYLFAAALLLLLSDLVLEKLYPEAYKGTITVSNEEADSVFQTILITYGIEDQWLSRKGEKYTVRIPVDVPAELIMLDLSEYYRDKNAVVSSKELVKGTRSLMELNSAGETVLSAEFIYEKNIKRKISTLAFILLNINRLNENEISGLLALTDNYTVALDPSTKNRDMSYLLKGKGKEYSLIINNNISELKYRLDDKFSDKKLTITIESITAHFPEAVYFILDDIPVIYSQRVDDLLHKEFDKRKMKYKYLKEFKQIRNISSPEEFREYINVHGDQVFTIDASEFLKYKDELKTLRKRGIKVSNLSALVL